MCVREGHLCQRDVGASSHPVAASENASRHPPFSRTPTPTSTPGGLDRNHRASKIFATLLAVLTCAARSRSRKIGLAPLHRYPRATTFNDRTATMGCSSSTEAEHHPQDATTDGTATTNRPLDLSLSNPFGSSGIDDAISADHHSASNANTASTRGIIERCIRARSEPGSGGGPAEKRVATPRRDGVRVCRKPPLAASASDVPLRASQNYYAVVASVRASSAT